MTYKFPTMISKLGDNLFASGNISDNFEKFSTDHQHNGYCKFFELEPFNTTSKMISKGSNEELNDKHSDKHSDEGFNEDDQEGEKGDEHWRGEWLGDEVQEVIIKPSLEHRFYLLFLLNLVSSEYSEWHLHGLGTLPLPVFVQSSTPRPAPSSSLHPIVNLPEQSTLCWASTLYWALFFECSLLSSIAFALLFFGYQPAPPLGSYSEELST